MYNNIIKFYGEGQDDPKELILQWNIGNVCNYSCEYCPALLHDGSMGWVELDVIKNLLTKFKKHFSEQVIKLELLGGEVTVKKDFIELMQFCKDEGFGSVISSNGSRTIQYWERLCPYLDQINFTFHPNFADRINFIQVLETCTKFNLSPFVSIAMVKPMFWELTEYCKELRSLFPNLNIDMMLLYDKQNNRNFNGFYYDYSTEEIDYLKNETLSDMKFYAETTEGETLRISLSELRQHRLNDFSGYTCGNKLSMIAIDIFGRASIGLCSIKPRVNVYNDNLDELFKPTLCHLDECKNPSDIRILKIKK